MPAAAAGDVPQKHRNVEAKPDELRDVKPVHEDLPLDYEKAGSRGVFAYKEEEDSDGPLAREPERREEGGDEEDEDVNDDEEEEQEPALPNISRSRWASAAMDEDEDNELGGSGGAAAAAAAAASAEVLRRRGSSSGLRGLGLARAGSGAAVAEEKLENGRRSSAGSSGGGVGSGEPAGDDGGEDYERELNQRELQELSDGGGVGGGSEEELQRPESSSDNDGGGAAASAASQEDGGREAGAVRRRVIDMLQGCRPVEDFERLNCIDEGTYGVVYRARDKRSGEVVALKRVKMDKEREGFPMTSLREINILLSFAHDGPHASIVDVREVVVGSNLDAIFMVMEYMDHDLKSLMETMKQPFSQSEVKCLMLQLFEGTHYLHQNWVLHRDLKTSNLLLNNKGELKICDFGLARQYGSPLKAYTHMVVTLWYRAPELLLGVKTYSTAIDMWSLGCIMAELLGKEPLFPGKSEIDQLDKIFRELGTPNEKIWPEFPSLLKKVNFVRQPYNKLRERFPLNTFGSRPTLSEAGFDLLNKLLTYDPKKRIMAEAALKHEWFREVPLPKAKELMPTFPARNQHDRRSRRIHKSPDPLLEQRQRQADLGSGGLFG
eukprot:SM000106S13964  [mRNA]  locus=s106:281759:284864:- [translate_table: standard]